MSHSVLYEWNSVDSALNIPILPDSKIRKICIYDFDNTLFKSPAPDPHLYSEQLYTSLLSPCVFSNGGWWSEPRFLELLLNEWQKGLIDDSAFWNRDIVKSAKESWESRDDGTLTILMTGRKELLFSPVFEKMFKHPVFGEKLSFNGAFLKRAGYPTTMMYKTSCLSSLVKHYTNLEKILIFDDRKNQLEGFDTFFKELKSNSDLKFHYTLIAVEPVITYLPPDKEISIVMDIFKEHNTDVKCKVKGLEMVHGPICSLGFQMEFLTLHADHNKVKYLLNCKESHKISELVARFSRDTKRKFQFTIPVVKPVHSFCSRHLSLQHIVTPDASIEDIKALNKAPTSSGETVSWSIVENLIVSDSKIVFLVLSPQKPGLHALFITQHDQDELQSLSSMIETKIKLLARKEEEFNFVSSTTFEYHYSSEPISMTLSSINSYK